MWKRTKNAGPTVNRLTVTRRRSKTHGVMITQYTVNMPEGKSTPDFQCKPIPVTLKEGKLAVFKATVTGDPKPEVSWRRAKGTMSDKDKFQSKYDESTGEHILEIHKVSAVESDTYKCFAVNEFGKAVCTTTLNVIEASSNPSDFRKLLRKSKVEQADGETDERFWDAMVKADRRDYERICAEFGVKDINLVLTKLEQKKKERVQNKCKDGVIPNDGGETERHMFKSGGTKGPGLKQVDEEEIFLPTDFKLSNVDFVIKIQEIKAQEREDALFECVLTHPLPRITWMGKGSTLEDGEKYSITVSDHKLIHRLLIKDCTQLDKSIYSAVAGITSCSAWLLVEAESERASAGKNKGRKNTLARGARIDLEKVAMEQQIKIRDEMGKILASVKSKQDGRQLKGEQTLPTCGKDGKTNAVTGQVEKSGAATGKPNAEKASSPSELAASKGKAKIKIFNEDGTVRELNVSDCETEDDINYPSHKKHSRYGQEGFDKVTDTNEEGYSDENEDFTGSANNSKYRKHDHKSGHTGIDSSGKMLDDIELNHTEVTDCDGNEDLPGVVGRQRQKKKVHWKQHASVCGSDTNNLASDNEASDSAENEDSTDLVKNSSCSKKSQKPQRAVNVRGSATVPHKQASDNDTGDNDASDGDGDEDSADLVKQSSRSKQSQKPQRAVNVYGSATVPNKQASDNDASDIDGDEDSTDQVKHSSRSNQSQKPKKVDNVCGPDTIPHKLASDNGARQSGENEDSTGLAKHSSCSRKSRKPQKTVNDPHKLASDNDESDNDENEDSTGLAKHSSCSRKSRKPQKTNNDPHKLASDNDESDNDENEDSTGLAKHSSCSRKSRKPQKTNNDPHKLASDNDESDNDENEDSTGLAKHSSCSRKSRKPQKTNNGESTDPEDHNECDETEDATGSASHSRRKRQGPLIEDTMIDPGVQFIWGLSDVNAVINETAEISCKLSSEDCEGAWFTAGKKIHPDDNFTITKDGAIHKLIIIRCKEEHSGKYRFEADGRKTVAMINVKDPPRFDPEDIRAFVEPLTVKVGHNAIFKMHFVGHDPIKIQWYKEGEELQDDNNTRIEKSTHHSRLLLSRCQRRDTGEIKIKLKNEHGFTEKISKLIVLDKPTSPLGPAEVTESSARCIEFKWRPPKDDGGSPVINYIMERQQVGRNTWKKIGEIPGVPSYRDTDVEHGRKYCYRIWAVTAEGTSEVLETDDMQAGTLAFPGPPSPPVVVSAYDDCINISWVPPANRGGSRILGYILEKRKKGSNLWTVVNAMDELIKENKYGVKDVVAGLEYEFRVTAINLSGVGEFSTPSEFVFARDPKKPPGKVTGLKVTETSYNHMVLTWTKPEERPEIQDEAKGYFVQIRQAECLEWTLCNTTPNLTTSYSVKGLKPMDMYWVRVIATNDGGDSAPEELANYVLAMPSPVRPKFTNHKMKSFMVVRAGNTVRITVNFEASPRPNIMWLKDNVPVTKRVTISNSDGSSQLLIPSSERSDSGIYSILVKNLAGQETFCTEVRVTDDPKPPGPVELEENVPGTVTVTWEPSPDEKRDDRLHYAVSKLDSTKRTWTIVAERLFNNKFTVCNIMHGRLYHFRVYAKNDMGVSAHSESPTWGMEKKKEKFVVSLPSRKDCDLRCAPTFLVPLKLHTAPKGYECYMSCAVKGNPKPRITWYRNHISLNTNTNYYISDTCGVCSMLILHVGPKDMGEYTISAENALGRAECSTVLSVRE